jgi:Protein of unknown function (DUF4007)
MTLPRPVFSGHETFQCRHLWLKKGYDYVKSGKSFTAEDAVVHLGVGKNMVGSIRYWMRAFDLLDADDRLTEFADQMFADGGFDPYLEDDASLWLLHYKLVIKNHATLYNVLFNEFRKERMEFTKDQFWNYIKYKFEDFAYAKNKQNTIDSDFVVFTRMYVGDPESKDKEDVITGILTELHLVRCINKNTFTVEPSERKSLPDAVILYTLAANERYGVSIDFQTLLSDRDGPGSIFAVNEVGMYAKLESIAENYADFIVFKDDAGARELQFKGSKPDPYTILKHYYSHAN